MAESAWVRVAAVVALEVGVGLGAVLCVWAGWGHAVYRVSLSGSRGRRKTVPFPSARRVHLHPPLAMLSCASTHVVGQLEDALSGEAGLGPFLL